MNSALEIARIRNGRTARFSSWDTSGRNNDSWSIPAGQSRVLADLKGPGVITHIWMTQTDGYRECLLKITWDDAPFPSILCPLGDFFGLGNSIVNSYQSLFFTASTAAKCRFNTGCALNCYAPMPFRKHAVVELLNESKTKHNQFFYVDYEQINETDLNGLGYFHAEFRRTNPFGGWEPETFDPEHVNVANKGRLAWDNNYVILETKGRGHYLGCNLSIANFQEWTWWGEGDDMIWVDGYKWPPDLHGTGSEDYFNQAWGMQPNAFLRNGSSIHQTESGGYQTSYIFHVDNPVRFQREIKTTIEVGHGNHSGNDVSSTAYWYAEKPSRIASPPPVAKRLPVLRDARTGCWLFDKKNQCPGKPVRLSAEMKQKRRQWLDKRPESWFPGTESSPFVAKWYLSRLCPKKGNVEKADYVRLDDSSLEWRPINIGPFVNVYDTYGSEDGIAYLGNRFKVLESGEWSLRIGHDGGLAVFVDGKRVLCQPQRVNPVVAGRSHAIVDLAQGEHEIVLALDTDHGLGWGVLFCFEFPPSRRKKGGNPEFPVLVLPAA